VSEQYRYTKLGTKYRITTRITGKITAENIEPAASCPCIVLGTGTRFNTRYRVPVTYPGAAQYPFVFLEIVKSEKV